MKLLRLLSALLMSAALSLLAARQLSVSEVNYNPIDGSDYEFIELVNFGPAPFDLSGAQFTNGIVYPFKAGTVLAAGARIVVCNSKAKFAERYGDIGARLAGSYDGKLSDDGETLTLVDAAGKPLLEFTYGTKNDWPSRADGLGSSLECIDPAADLDDPANWRSSTEYNGSPGTAGVGPLRTVVINEVLTHTDPPIEDAVELHNLTDQPINLGGWYLSNSRADPMKFRFPAGTTIAAHSFKVIYELRGTGNPAGFNSSGTGNAPDFTFNSAHGDEAVLVSTDSGGNLRYWVDAVSFDAAQHGYSFGRYPDFTGPLVTMDHLTLGTAVDATFPEEFLSVFRTGKGASNALPKVGPLVFNRLMYHPSGPGDEFVEVLNIASTNVPLSDPLFPTNTWRLRKAIDFDFPSGAKLVPGEKALVVPLAPATFRAKYSIPAAVQVFGPYTNQLGNEGESLQLFKPDPPQDPPHPDVGFVPYILVDKVDYLPTAPWPIAADGTGPALQRIDPTRYGNDPANWTTDAAPAPPVISATLIDAATVQVSFTAAPGRGYVVETRGDVASGPDWTAYVVLDPTPSGSPVRLSISISAARQFIRVR